MPAGERHLRLLLEAAVDPHRAPADPEAELAVAGDALAAAGLVDPALARRLLAELRLALALRRDPPPWPLPPGRAPAAEARPVGGTPEGPRAVALGPLAVPTATGALGVLAVSVGADGATLHATFDADGGMGEGAGRRPAALARGPQARRARAAGPAGTRAPAAPAPPGTTRQVTPGRDTPGGALRALELTGDGGPPAWVGPVGRAATAAGGWRLACPVDGLEPATAAVAVRLGGRPVGRLATVAARPALAGREHRRRPAAVWVAGALGRVASGAGTGPVGAGVRALIAAGALDPGDPLAHQAALLDELGPGGDASGLDARWRSALERRHAPAEVTGAWAVGAFVDLGTERVRFDAVHAGPGGLWLLGACGPVAGGRGADGPAPVGVAAYDDRLNGYVLAGPLAPAAGAAVWRLVPELDPAASSLRIEVTGSTREASVEVTLR